MGERRPATANGGAYRLVRRLWLLVGERGRRAPAAGVGINRVSTPFEQNGTSTCIQVQVIDSKIRYYVQTFIHQGCSKADAPPQKRGVESMFTPITTQGLSAARDSSGRRRVTAGRLA